MSAVERAAEVLAGRLMAQNPSWFRALSLQKRDAYARESADTLAKGLAHELAAAGLLAEPTDQDQRETRTEWGVRVWPGKPHEGVRLAADQQTAEREAARWRGVVVRREVSLGPWVEAPSPSP